MNRQTLTYEGLSKLMYGHRAAGVLDKILGHIAFFCIDEGLPPLTSIVVGKQRGAPGHEIPIDLTKVDSERERVYRENWFDIFPPTPEKLAEAHTKYK